MSSVRLGKWSQPGFPHTGWRCDDIEDLGSPSAVCGMCEHQSIRFVHYMAHPAYRGFLACGCECASRMEGDAAGAERRDAAMRSLASRRKRWPDLKGWHLSRAGNWTITKDGFRVTIVERPDGWQGHVVWVATDTFHGIPRRSPSVRLAQLAAFDTIVRVMAMRDRRPAA